LAQAAADALDELQAYDFATGVQEALKAGFAGVPQQALASALLQAYSASRDPDDLPDPATLTAVASFLIFATSVDAARKALKAQFDGTAEHLLMAELLGMQPDVPVPASAIADFVAMQLPNIKPMLGRGAEGPVALNQALLELPTILRQPIVEAVLRHAKPSKQMLAFAALSLLFPFEAGTKRLALGWLGEQGGAETAAFLQVLPAGMADAAAVATARRALVRRGVAVTAKAKALPGIPLDWPVVEAYASTVDGQGSQGLYLLRRISPSKLALVGAVCNDQRGIAEGIHVPEAPAAALRAMLAGLTADRISVTPVPAAYVVQRILAGVELARTLQLPLPFEFQLGRYLLAGLDAGASIDSMAMVRPWADPASLPDTHYLLHTLGGSSWYFDVADGLTTAFLMAADKALKSVPDTLEPLSVPPDIAAEADYPDGLLLHLQREAWLAEKVDAAAEKLFTPQVRWRWCRRLAEMAYWFDADGRPTMRRLAATAAVVMDPGSPVPLTEQPLAAAMVRLSVLARYE
jgi:hypothetical protein